MISRIRQGEKDLFFESRKGGWSAGQGKGKMKAEVEKKKGQMIKFVGKSEKSFIG